MNSPLGINNEWDSLNPEARQPQGILRCRETGGEQRKIPIGDDLDR